MAEKIKVLASIESIRYYNEQKYFGIIECSIDKDLNKCGILLGSCIILKGRMADPKKGEQYEITAVEVNDPRWGKQYEIKNIMSCLAGCIEDERGQKKFLYHLFTEKQVSAMYASLDNPFQALADNNIEELIKIKGCGIKTAYHWIEKFNNNYSYCRMYVELEKFDLTPNMIKKLFEHYRSAEVAIKTIKNNPYTLCEISGVGWKKADQIALAGGMAPNSLERIESYMIHYLEEQAQNGYSYIPPDELMGAIVDNIDENISDYLVTSAIHDLREQDKLWWDDEKTKIGLYFYYDLERKIATELLRIRDAQNKFEYDGWEEIIRQKELEQGWQYTEQQLTGIQMALENNIVCITGYGGTGKSSIVDGMLAALPGYYSVTCALAGRAASRISELTGKESYTIHRLLGYPSKDKNQKNGFTFHDEFPLDAEIIIVDEISMIGGRLFYYLLRAIQSGAKLILLGDIGQLESIGECKVAADIIVSPEIPSIFLDKIHRQAQRSAIITDSIAIRKGGQLVEKDWTGEQVRGELQDLLLDCYSDKSNTYYKTLQHFSKELDSVKSIMDLQVLCPVRTKGDACVWNLNNAIQEIYNPMSSKKNEIDVFYSASMVGTLREGDKVINRKNHYSVFDVNTEQTTAIYNGNIGIVNKVDPVEKTVTVEFPGIGLIFIPENFVRDLELGYVITCHSSQGSQFERVIVALDFTSYVMLSRELVYTAVTRAMKHCTLVAQTDALRYAIATENIKVKDTHLLVLLDELAHPKIVF